MRAIWHAFLASLLIMVIILQLVTLTHLTSNSNPNEIHTVILKWKPQTILSIKEQPNNVASGYVDSWKPRNDVRIIAVQVWMGNPSNISWEGDVYITLNNRGDFQSTDQVIVHYQFDKHAESSLPHQKWFQIGYENSGFPVKKSQTVWAWFAFVNTSNKSTAAGDGEVIIYYLND
jgi:hypothetical protein